MGPNFFVFAKTRLANAAIMPKPSGEWLDDDLRTLRTQGFDLIVSLLEPHEVVELGLQNEAEACQRVGLQLVRLPIPDRGVPGSPMEFADLVRQLFADFQSGKSIAIHCRAGIGRSGMVAAALLMRGGCSPQAAIDAVSAARKVPTPDTDEQIEFLHQLTRVSQ